MPILPNEVYELRESPKDTVRILAVWEQQTVVVISLINKDTLPYEIPLSQLEEAVSEKKAVYSTEYPPAFFPNPTEKQVEAAKESWDIIGPFVQDIPDCYDKKVRSRFIAAKSKETSVYRQQIQRLLYRYWANGMSMHALYPQYDKRGAPGISRSSSKRLGRPVKCPVNNLGVSIGEQELSHIREAISKYYTKHTKFSYRFAYRQMIKEHYIDPVTGLLSDAYPTENQFRYHAIKFVDIKKRVGGVKYNKDFRGILDSSRREADGPGDVYQIDATVADIYLVSRYDYNTVVGRPELYFVTDVFSRMIVGFYACLESASWDNARSALLNAFAEKAEFCREYGIEISEEDWPCVGLPRALIVDNGELISKASDAIIFGLGITVKNEPAWRPDLKGIVESRFRLLNISTKAQLPGAVLPDFAQRGAPDYRLDATLTLTDFIKIVINFILNHNKRPLEQHPQPLPDVLADHVPPIPLDLWKWGIANRSGCLRQMRLEDMQVALAQRDSAHVTPKGIKFHNLYYQCKTAIEENWFSSARIKGGWKVDIAYHPKNMDKIYWLKNPQNYEDCTRTRDSGGLYHQGDSLDEILWLQRRRGAQKSAYSDVALQSEVDSSRAIDEIIRQANEKNKMICFETARSKAKPGEIRKNRKAEAEMIRRENQAETGEHLEKPIKRSSSPKSTSGYDVLFAQFSEEEEDD